MSQLDALSPVATPGFPSTEQRLGSTQWWTHYYG